MTKHAEFKRRVRARAAKTGESYTTARSRLIESGALHVTNGDSTVPALRATGLAEQILVWRDVLHEGPVPNLPDAELRRIRAAFLHGEHASDIGTVAEFTERDRTLTAHRAGDYVLWFEADLYDQLQILQILARLHEIGVPPRRITLICIGEFPGIAHFGGLGELDSDQLSRLPDMAAITLTDAALDYATRAWAALRAPEPTGLNTVIHTPSPELRFVAESFDRLGREYPSTRDGLSLTERRALAAVAEGASTAGVAFVRAAAKELRPFLGDDWCFDRIRRLAKAPVPLLDIGPADSVDRHTPVRLTDAGQRVLNAQADHVTLNGIDRWIGGVHLTGPSTPWRWNEATESVTRASSG